jgi:hypothetical protein
MLPVVGHGFYLAINTGELPEIMKHADNRPVCPNFT